MSYTLPAVRVFQEFRRSTLAVNNPLRVILVGGNAELFRYDDADEKALISLGAYDPDIDQDYAYPNRPAGGIVDQSKFVLHVDDALLRYFHDPVGTGSTQSVVSGYKNRIRSSTINYVENVANGTTYARAASLLDRDVKVGDYIDVAGTVDGEATTVRAKVIGIVGDTVAAVVAAAEGDENNQATIAADQASTSKTGGDDNCVVAVSSASAYSGAADGDITETYTVTVTQGSTDGDFTTALLRVRSASGNDDEDDVVPAAAGSPTTIGARGLTMTFDVNSDSCSLSAEADDVSRDDLIEGQEWTIEVQQQFTAPTATSGGTYRGDTDTTYIIEVVEGGTVGPGTGAPKIQVSTVHGIDVSGPTAITAINTAVAVGTEGVTVRFDQSELRKGDFYYIDVTAEYEGDMRTLVIDRNLPADMVAASDLGVSLYIRREHLVIPHKRVDSAPDYNYELGDAGDSDTGFTVKAGIVVTDSEWTDDDVEQPIDLHEGTLYAEYRAWVSEKADSVYAFTSEDDYEDIPGAIEPDNVLKYAISKAWSNSGGVDIRYLAVSDPSDQDAWVAALSKLVGYRGVYSVVPLTTDGDIVDLFKAHVESQSQPEVGLRRILWTLLQAEEEVVIVSAANSGDGEVVLATTEDDPEIDGNQYTILEVPAGNGDFITNGVQAGDTVRFLYTTDGWGDETYSEFEVDAVINEDSLRLVSGTDTPVSVARKIEVWRTLSANALAEQLADQAGTFNSTRVRCVWPDEVTVNGETVSGLFVLAALAGLRSGSLPHRPLTNVSLSGFDATPRSNDLFNATQLNTMAEGGVWIVHQNDDGEIVTRHALTSVGYGDVITQEDSCISNADSRSMAYQECLRDLVGTVNLTQGTIDVILLRITAKMDEFKAVTNEQLGGQLVDGEIVSVRRHAVFADRLVVELDETQPAPLNNIDVHQNIVV